MMPQRSLVYSKNPEPVHLPPKKAIAFIKALSGNGFKTYDSQMIFLDAQGFGATRSRTTAVRKNDLPNGAKVELGLVYSIVSFNDMGSSYTIDGGMIQMAPLTPESVDLIKISRNKQHFGIKTPDEGLIYAAVIAAANLADIEKAVRFHDEFTAFMNLISNSRFPKARALMHRIGTSVLDGIMDRDFSKLPKNWDVHPIDRCLKP